VLPNLTAGAPTPNKANTNVQETFSAIISNADAPTGAGFNNFFQIATDIANPVTYIDKPFTAMPALGKNSTAVTTTTHTFTTPGMYYIRACADKNDRNTTTVTDSVNESNENDNCGPWTTVTVLSNLVNGVCSSPLVNNTCAAGDLLDTADTLTQFLWNCNGINNGTNASCVLNRPNLTAGAPTPNTAVIHIPKTFSAVISNAFSPTGFGFNNFFQISTGPNMTGTVINELPSFMNALAA